MKLGKFICEVLLAREIEDGEGKDDFLLDTAKFYKVNVKKIEREFQKEIDAKKLADKQAAAAAKKLAREKERKKAARAAKPNGSAPPDKSESALIAHALHSEDGRDKILTQPDGRAFYIYPEPTCIHCGCTYFNPCPGGCSWSVQESKTNRGLCSACRGKGRVFTPVLDLSGKEVDGMGAKKASKKKSKKKSAKAASDKANTREAPAGAV
jgi:hypothetical protein